MLTHVAGQPLQCAPHVDDCADLLVVPVEPVQLLGFLQSLVQRHADLEWNELCDPVHESVGLAHDSADVPDHGPGGHGAVGGDLGNVVPAVFPRHVLDDAVAAFHAEVHVEVRHGDPLGIQESFEEEVVGQWVDVGDAEGIRHQGTGSRSPPRPYGDSIRPRPGDEIRDDQEVAGESHGLNDLELRLQAFPVGSVIPGNARPYKPVFQAPAGTVGEVPLEGGVFGDGECRQAVAPEAQFQVAAPGNLHGVLQRLGQIREQLGHLPGAAQVLLLGISSRTPGVRQHVSLLNAHPRLVRIELLAIQKPDVIGGRHGNAAGRGELERSRQVAFVVFTSCARDLHVETLGEHAPPPFQTLGGLVLAACQERNPDVSPAAARQGDHAVRVLCDPVPLDTDLTAPPAAPVSHRGQSREGLVPRNVLCQEHKSCAGFLGRTLAHLHFHAHDGLHAGVQGGTVEFHHPEKVAEVGHGYRRHAQRSSSPHQRFQPNQSIGEGELAVQVQVNERGVHDGIAPAARAWSTARTGLNERRWTAVGPSLRSARRCCAVG